jgi:hypothetical protein
MENDNPTKLTKPLTFARGRRFFQIAPAYVGNGYVGVCDGRIITSGLDPAVVARALIQGTP